MKIKTLTLLLSGVLLLGSCQNTNEISTSSDDSLVTSSEVSSTSTYLHPDSNWGGQLGDDIIESFGVDIPTLGYGELMDYTLDKDAFNDATIFIHWTLGDDTDFDKALDTYFNICSLDGWECTSSVQRNYDRNNGTYVEYTIYYADKVISEDTGIEIQFLEGGVNGVPCLGFYIMSYPHYDKKVWPTSVINKIISTDIPHLPENDYEYTATLFDNETYTCCEVLVSGSKSGDEEKYKDLLTACDFNVSELLTDEDYGFEYYFAYSPDMTFAVRFWFDYLQNSCLTIYIYPITVSA